MVTATPVTLCIQKDTMPGFLFFARSLKPSFNFWIFMAMARSCNVLKMKTKTYKF